MDPQSEEYGEHHYEHETEVQVSYDDTNEETQPQAQQPDPNQQHQQRSAPPSRSPPPPLPPSQAAQNHYSNPAYATQPPRNYPPQASPQHFPPQSGYYPAQSVKGQPQNYPPQASPHKPQPSSPYHQNGAVPMYQNGGYGAQGVQMNGAPAPGYMVQQSPYPMAGYPRNTGTVGWSTGLFDCMDDPNNALITACCPCFTFGQVAEIVDNGHTTCATSGILYCVIAAFTAVPCLISCTYRTKMRNQYDLIEVPAADWITHCFCEWCALCQEYRELKIRGLDPALGWQGNMMRNQNMQQQPQVAMMPPGNQTMASPNFAK